MRSRILRASRSASTRVALVRLYALAYARGCRPTIEVHRTAHVSPKIRIKISGRRFVLRVGPGCVIEDGVTLQLGQDATVDLRERVTVRHGAVLNVSGRLDLQGDNLVSWYSVIHCAESITWGRLTGTGEHVTVVDSGHYRSGSDDHWYHNATTGPVVIGDNVWLASKCTVTRDVTIGSGSNVGANSVVLHDVPPDSSVAGAPARVTRRDINRAP